MNDRAPVQIPLCRPFRALGICGSNTQGGASRRSPRRSALGWYVTAFQA